MPGKAEDPHAGAAGPVAADTGRRPAVARALATWHELATALAPIVGDGGFAALYRRSVHRVVPRFPWLGTLEHAGDAAAFEPQSLQAVLAQQSTLQVAAANAALLVEFGALLHQLIGAALAQELMSRHVAQADQAADAAD